jgi:hypothetical protein
MNTDNLTSGDGASEQVSSGNTIIGVSQVGPIEKETTLIEKFELPPNEQSMLQNITAGIALIKSVIGRYEESKKQDELLETAQREWSIVAQVLDRLLLVIFLILSIFFTLGILIQVSTPLID